MRAASRTRHAYIRAAQCSLTTPIEPGIQAPPLAPGPRKPVGNSFGGCFCQGFDPLYESSLHAAFCGERLEWCSKAVLYSNSPIPRTIRVDGGKLLPVCRVLNWIRPVGVQRRGQVEACAIQSSPLCSQTGNRVVSTMRP